MNISPQKYKIQVRCEYEVAKQTFIKEELEKTYQQNNQNSLISEQQGQNIPINKTINHQDSFIKQYKEWESDLQKKLDSDTRSKEQKMKEIEDIQKQKKEILELIKQKDDISPEEYFDYPEMVIIEQFKVKDAIKECENDLLKIDDLKQTLIFNYCYPPKQVNQQQEIGLLQDITNIIYEYYQKFKKSPGPILLLEDNIFIGQWFRPAFRSKVREYFKQLEENDATFLTKFLIINFLLAEQEIRDEDYKDNSYFYLDYLLFRMNINLEQQAKEQYLEQMNNEFQHTTLKYI